MTGRYIDIAKPENGRYTKRRLKVIHNRIKYTVNQLMQRADNPSCKSHGNKLMVFCGIISLAAYREMRNEGVSHQYATILVGDVIWKLYILGVKPLWIIAGAFTRNPQKRLNYTLRILCIYPFNTDKNGYQYTLQTMSDHLAMDFSQCVVHQFMKTAGSEEEMDFFCNTWCLYDFALPPYLVNGGSYERMHTLSHGDNICDMKWYAAPKEPGQND